MNPEYKAKLQEDCKAAIAAGGELEQNVDFYSKGCPGLVANLHMGRIARSETGHERRVDQIIAEFRYETAVKNEDGSALRFGRYSTRNPLAVLALIKRIEEKGDVCDSAEFERLTLSKEEQVRRANTRATVVENELQKYLRENEELRKRVEAITAAGAATPKTAAAATK